MTAVESVEQVVSKVVYACEKTARWRTRSLRNIVEGGGARTSKYITLWFGGRPAESKRGRLMIYHERFKMTVWKERNVDVDVTAGATAA